MMARIRSLHPSQLTDEDYVRLSMTGRVLTNRLENFADDHGVFAWDPVILKMRIFPADNLEIEELLAELETYRQVKAYWVEGKKYGVLRNFAKRQKPKSPSYRYPVTHEMLAYAGSSPTAALEVGNALSPTAPISEIAYPTAVEISEMRTAKEGSISEILAHKEDNKNITDNKNLIKDNQKPIRCSLRSHLSAGKPLTTSDQPCQPQCESISEGQEPSLPAEHLPSEPIQPWQTHGTYSDPMLEEFRLLNVTRRAAMARGDWRPPMDKPPAAYPAQQEPTAPFQVEGESLNGNWELAEQPYQQPASPAQAAPLELPASGTENPQQEPILHGYDFPAGGEEKNLLPAQDPPPATEVPFLEPPSTALEEPLAADAGSHHPPPPPRRMTKILSTLSKTSLDKEFEEWWQQVPVGRKVGPSKARTLYGQARKAGASREDLLNGIQRDAAVWANEETALRFIPHPATWLGQGRWKGDPPAAGITIPGEDQDGLPAYLAGQRLGAKDKIFAAAYSLCNRYKRAGMDPSAPNVSLERSYSFQWDT